MKPFSPSRRAVSPATARSALLVNQFATPGLGSLMAGRWLAGTGQLALAVAGFVMVVAWFLETMVQLYGQIDGDVPPHPVGWIGATGAILFAMAWLWALVTSVSLVRETAGTGETSPENPEVKAMPPRMADLPDKPPKQP
jgi:hypothetical protein